MIDGHEECRGNVDRINRDLKLAKAQIELCVEWFKSVRARRALYDKQSTAEDRHTAAWMGLLAADNDAKTALAALGVDP